MKLELSDQTFCRPGTHSNLTLELYLEYKLKHKLHCNFLNSKLSDHRDQLHVLTVGADFFHLFKLLAFGSFLLAIFPFSQVNIHHASEVDEIFDAISYDKGASVIRMLQNYLGAERFQVCIGSP